MTCARHFRLFDKEEREKKKEEGRKNKKNSIEKTKMPRIRHRPCHRLFIKEKKEGRREKKYKKIHVIVHVACHVGKTTVKRGFGPG
jgi:hypothetical protein